MTDSIIRGKPLADEALGALTLGGFLREVCAAHGPREALVYHLPDGSVLRLSYQQVWEQAFTVARALVARGVTKETRVGLLVTNRAEWVTSMFGIALAGGTCVALSTFAKGAELEYMLRVGDVSLLIFERSILARDFGSELIEICPELGGKDLPIASTRLPYLRRAVCVGEPPAGSAIERWEDFLKGPLASAALVEAMSAEV
ncbi:MAG TPA: AMP-binding protein, partial [Fontimonas sp.]